MKLAPLLDEELEQLCAIAYRLTTIAGIPCAVCTNYTYEYLRDNELESKKQGSITWLNKDGMPNISFLEFERPLTTDKPQELYDLIVREDAKYNGSRSTMVAEVDLAKLEDAIKRTKQQSDGSVFRYGDQFPMFGFDLEVILEYIDSKEGTRYARSNAR